LRVACQPLSLRWCKCPVGIVELGVSKGPHSNHHRLQTCPSATWSPCPDYLGFPPNCLVMPVTRNVPVQDHRVRRLALSEQAWPLGSRVGAQLGPELQMDPVAAYLRSQ
jgi:hypothetical protein